MHTPGVSDAQANKALVRRLIDEVMNGGRLDAIDDLYTPGMARAARRWIEPFRASFPDVRMEVVDLVDEVYFFRMRDGRIGRAWGREDTLSRVRQLGLPEEPA